MRRIRISACVLLAVLLAASAAFADIWYRDADGDGYGDDNDWLDQPTQPAGYVATPGDCNDSVNWIYPGAVEIVADGVDSDCNGMESCYEDLDWDGYGTYVIVQSVDADCYDPGESANTLDCDDTQSTVYPGATEIVGDGVDQDCDGGELCYEDADGDSYGSSSTVAGFDLDCYDYGESNNDFDCDDTDAGVYPGATEYVGDGVDQDCDGQELCYLDLDNDGYGTSSTVLSYNMSCSGSNESLTSDDCDDTLASVHPGASEIWYDGIDQDCDGANDFDQDGDGYVATGYEAEAGGTAPYTGDCDDTRAAVHPGAEEICGDGLDNDCDPGTSDICAALGIASITDVGNDQGGQVRIAWSRAQDDEEGATEPVTAYDVYRRIDAYKAADSGSALAEKAWPAGDWDFVAQVPASGEEVYHTVVPTLCDSTDAGVCWSVFFLRARTAAPTVFTDCAPDSGYSIDNLAPEAPLNLAAAYAAEDVSLMWDESEAADFDYFRIYRSADPDFTPAPELLVRSTTATSWTDPVDGGWDLHYKITAVDFAGNEGPPTSVQHASGSDLPPSAGRLALHPNVPNPFNPSTTIEFELPDARRVRLEIFTLDGRRVAVLAEGWRESGLHRVVWNGRSDSGRAVASGAYLYRLDAGDRVLSRRLMLVK